MSTSLMKKGLKLFEEKSEKVLKIGRQKQASKANQASSLSTTLKQQPTLKDRKIKSVFDAYVKKNRKGGKTDNLAILLKLSQKNHLDQASADKILSYHWKKHRKIVETEPEKNREGTTTTVFTEEDFLKFEQEYFAK